MLTETSGPIQTARFEILETRALIVPLETTVPSGTTEPSGTTTQTIPGAIVQFETTIPTIPGAIVLFGATIQTIRGTIATSEVEPTEVPEVGAIPLLRAVQTTAPLEVLAVGAAEDKRKFI